MPSPRPPDPRLHARLAPDAGVHVEPSPTVSTGAQATTNLRTSTSALGPDHHLREQWHEGYPGAAIVIPAHEGLADRDLIGE